jgi:protein TonB
LAVEPNYALPIFYIGVLDEAEENWSAAEVDFRRFLALETNSDLSVKARRELEKLPGLIKQDSTPSGKLDRHYRQHLALADLLQKQGFAKEALLEAAEAARLAPKRWESYAVASAIMLSQGEVSQAKHFLELAKQRAPASDREKLAPLAARIQRQSPAASYTSATQQAPTQAPAAERPRRIVIGGNVTQAKITHQVTPIYPPIAKSAHLRGTVVLHCIIGTDGSTQQVEYKSGPPLLMKAAMDAVRQWRYQPTLLDGRPVEVDTTVSVIFSLAENPAPAPSASPPD